MAVSKIAVHDEWLKDRLVEAHGWTHVATLDTVHVDYGEGAGALAPGANKQNVSYILTREAKSS